MTTTTRTVIAGFAGLLLASCAFAGCSSSSSTPLVPGTSLSDSTKAEATAANGQTTVALSAMALQASLNQVDPTNYPALTNPPSVSATGNATSGTVTLDFGSGTTINNAIIAGTVSATYTASGSTVAVTVTFGNVTATTTSAGAVDISGSLTTTATLSGTGATATATGSVTGTVTAVGLGDTTTVTPNLTFTLDATTGRMVLNGTMGLDSGRYDAWTANMTSIGATVNVGARVIDAGTLALTNNTIGSLVVATFTFTGANTGILSIAPTGISQAFAL